MKVILINTVYPAGSTGKIVEALEQHYRSMGIKVLILYGHGKKSDGDRIKIASDFYMKLQALRSRLTGVMYGGCLLSTRRAIRIIQKEKPDIVHLHCLNSNFINIFRLLTWLKQNYVCTVLTNHAEFMYTANCGHAFECERYQIGCVGCPRPKLVTKAWFMDRTHRAWVRMKCAFEGFSTLLVTNVSPWLTERASHSTMLKEFEHQTVCNGVDTSVFYYRGNHSSYKTKMVLHVTAKFSDNHNDLKGGRFLIQLAKRFEGQNVRFVVAGKHCNDIVVPSNVELLGLLTDQNRLAELYSQADIVVITSKRETFSLITTESLCCGTPVVGFQAGAPEQIALPQYSEFVEYGNGDALFDAVQRMLSSVFDHNAISEVAREKYSNEKMTGDYLRIYEQCLNAGASKHGGTSY